MFTTPPNEIAENEVIVRGILTPLFASSKGKLSRNAFLPPRSISPNYRYDVSVLRHNYCNADFCKTHIKQRVIIPNNTYIGLAIFCARVVKDVNEEANNMLKTQETYVSLKATPITKEDGKFDYDLPMHADIIYSLSYIKDEPLPQVLKLVSELILKKAKMCVDTKPEKDGWFGEDLIPFDL